jgi:hypothetical protein
MPLIDFATAVKPEVLYKPAGYAIAQYDPDSSLTYGFDSRGSYAAVIVVNCGALVGTATLTLTLQESVDGTTWTPITDGDFPVIAASPSGDQVSDEALYFARVNFVYKQRYIGLKAIVAANRATFGVTALLLSYDTRNNTTPSIAV